MLEGSGRGLVGQCLIESTVVGSDVPGLRIHSPPHPGQLPVLRAPLMGSAQCRCTMFYLSWYIFTVPFPHVDVFRHTRMYHCAAVACSVLCGTCWTSVPPGHNRLSRRAEACDRPHHLGLCRCALWCLRCVASPIFCISSPSLSDA